MDKAQPMQKCSMLHARLPIMARCIDHDDCKFRQWQNLRSSLDAGLTCPYALFIVLRASRVPGLTDSNASLAAENTRLNDRMAKLVKDLTEENMHLLNENQRLNETVQKVSSLPTG